MCLPRRRKSQRAKKQVKVNSEIYTRVTQDHLAYCLSKGLVKSDLVVVNVKTRLRSRVSLAKLLGLSVRAMNDELPRCGLEFRWRNQSRKRMEF